MNEFRFYNKYYITVDNRNRIVDAWSDGPRSDKDTSKAICINDKGSYQFRLTPGGEENPSMWTMDGIPLYKWNGKQAVRRSELEIASDRAAIPAPPPTTQEKDRADIDFLAAMMGVSL